MSSLILWLMSIALDFGQVPMVGGHLYYNTDDGEPIVDQCGR